MKLPKYADPAANTRLEAVCTKNSPLLTDNIADPNDQGEERDMNQNLSCCICFDNPANAVNMQCGHGGICYDCGKSILLSKTRLCHLCREPLLFVLEMDLVDSFQDFIKVVAASYLSEGEGEGEDSENEQNNLEDEAGAENVVQSQMPEGERS